MLACFLEILLRILADGWVKEWRLFLSLFMRMRSVQGRFCFHFLIPIACVCGHCFSLAPACPLLCFGHGRALPRPRPSTPVTLCICIKCSSASVFSSLDLFFFFPNQHPSCVFQHSYPLLGSPQKLSKYGNNTNPFTPGRETNETNRTFFGGPYDLDHKVPFE
jgi:hypothetical protein